MPQKKFVFRQFSRYICTRRILFTLQINVTYLFQMMMTLFPALSAGAKTVKISQPQLFDDLGRVLNRPKIIHITIAKGSFTLIMYLIA